MRKWIYVLTALMLAVLACPFGAGADSEYQYALRPDGTAELTGYPYTAKMVFPSEVDGHPVSAISNPKKPKGDKDKITEAVIPEGVTEIGGFVFSNARKLSKVTLPSTLTRIGEKAFAYSGLKQVVIPEGVTEIGEEAFTSAKDLAKAALPSTLTRIGKRTFYNTGLRELTVPEGVTDIGEEAFDSCGSLEKLTLPSTLKTIGNKAFYHHSVKELTIPEGVERIGNAAFQPAGPKILSRVIFSGTDLELGKGIFGYAYKSGKDRDNPDNWKDYFAETGDTPYTLAIDCWPGSAADKKYIYSVKKTYLQWGEEQILTAPADRVLGAGLMTPESRIYELIIPEGVEEIAAKAFADTRLCKITFPSTLKKIGAGAFSGCAALKEIALPGGLEEMGSSAFMNCSSLEKINIPDGMSEIPDSVFEHCVSLSKLALPKEGLKRIGNRAFYECSALADMKLPAGLREIGEDAFSHTGLKNAVIPDSVSKIGNGAFSECDGLPRSPCRRG